MKTQSAYPIPPEEILPRTCERPLSPTQQQTTAAMQEPISAAQQPGPTTQTPALAMQQLLPHPQQPTPAAEQSLRSAKPAGSGFELTLGGKVLGIIAAVLVLAGLILLGVTFIPQLPDAAKVSLMFGCAALLTGAGTFITRRGHNVLGIALLSSGTLAGFVTIFSARSYFALIDPPVALVLAAAWMLVTIVLIWLCRAWPLSIVLGASAALFGIPSLEDMLETGQYQDSYIVFGFAFGIVTFYVLATQIIGAFLATSSKRHNASKCLTNLFTAEIALAIMALASAWHYSQWATLVLLGALLLALKLAPLPSPLATHRVELHVNEVVVLAASVIPISASGIAGGTLETTSAVLLCVFMALVALLYGVRAKELIGRTEDNAKSSTALAVVQAFVGTILLLSFLVDGLGVVSPGYMWSAVALACSFVAICVGFAARHDGLRIYGLAASLACVFKIVALDFTGSSLEHAAALLVGGGVCFAISALYTLTTKRLKTA